jgi:hypothetical protein
MFAFGNFLYFCRAIGGLAQLARALAWHARGHRFDSDILHVLGVSLGVSVRVGFNSTREYSKQGF